MNLRRWLMKKTLYSLTLSEDVVRAVDAMAHQMGMSRSGLVNQILADYVSVTTPERHINQVFQAIQALVAPGRELVPFFTPNSATMSLKSSLMYKCTFSWIYFWQVCRDLNPQTPSSQFNRDSL